MSPQVSNQRWELLIKLASLVCTVIVIPGIGWAWTTSEQIRRLQSQFDMIAKEFEIERRGSAVILEEIRSLRTSVDSLKSELLQRVAKVETKLETR